MFDKEGNTSFLSLKIASPVDSLSSAKPLGNSLHGWAKKGQYIPPAQFILSKHASISETVLHHFLKDSKENPSMGLRYSKTPPSRQGTWKVQVILLPRPSLPLLPLSFLFASYIVQYTWQLSLLRLWTELPQCSYSVVWHWTLCLGSMVVCENGNTGAGKVTPSHSAKLFQSLSHCVGEMTSVWQGRFSESLKELLQWKRIVQFSGQTWSLPPSGGSLQLRRRSPRSQQVPTKYIDNHSVCWPQ